MFRLFAILLCFSVLIPAARAADVPSPWIQVEAGARLSIRAIVPIGARCPVITADGEILASARRGEADEAYPLQLCVADAQATASRLAADGILLPRASQNIRRIVVIGDTGCRLKGHYIQDCNDPSRWPFSVVAQRAALQRPDLVIHVGDYHYRESPCPAGNPGCAGSPWGDNWQVWRRDFFDPAAPLLAAAPWVMVRGNHEICSRGGHGWARLLDPDPGAPCRDVTEPYRVDIGPLHLLVFDSADADDAKAPAGKVAVYRRQFAQLLSDVPSGSWLLTHRPFWALAQGDGIPRGATTNATEQAAVRGLIPPALDLILSGHVHDFTSYDFGPSRPAQLVVGDSGTADDPIVQPVHPGVVIDELPIRRVFATPAYGYVLLERSGTAWAGTVYSVNDEVLARCQLSGRDLACAPPAR